MDTSRLIQYLQKFFPLILSIVAGVVYLMTLAPSVVEIDSGELAAVQYNLGIAHPTGYPLFAILGWLLSHIPTGMPKILQMNLMATLYCSGAIFFFASSMQTFLANYQIRTKKSGRKKSGSKSKSKGKSGKKTASQNAGAAPKSTQPKATVDKQKKVIRDLLANLVAVTAGTLMLAFSQTFWIQSTSVEVYSLHMLLINLTIFFTLRFWFDETGDKKHAILLGVAVGLLFSNHLSSIMLLPGLAVILIAKFIKNTSTWKNYLMMIGSGAGILVLTYGFLMIRAGMDPILNWGNPENMEFLIRHTSGQQFQIWLFESTEASKANFDNFFARLLEEYILPKSVEGNYTLGFVATLLGLIIAVVAFLFPKLKFQRKRLPLFLFFAATAIFTVLWAINYNINDLESYFLLTYVMIGFWMTALWKWVFDYFGTKLPLLVGGAAVVLILVGVQMGVNFKSVNKSKVYAYQDYTLAAFESLPENAVLFSFQWDHLISPSYYYQFVEEKRTDIAIVDTEMLTNRRWYFDQLEINYPGLFKGVPMEVQRFKEELLVFDREENPDVMVLGNNLRAIFKGMITAHYPDRIAYIAPEVYESNLQQGGSLQLPEGYSLVPDHFFYKVQKGAEYSPLEDRDFKIRLGEKPGENEVTDTRIEYIREVRPKLLRDRALYELSYGKVAEAQIRVDRLHNDYPWYQLPPPLQGMLRQ